MNLFNGLQVQG